MVSTLDRPHCNTLHAFTSGFDPEGAERFKGKLVGRKKWIGTAGTIVLKSFYRFWLMSACARIIRGIHVQRDPVCYVLKQDGDTSLTAPPDLNLQISIPLVAVSCRIYLYILTSGRLNAGSYRSGPIARLDQAVFRRQLSRPPGIPARVVARGYPRDSNGPHTTHSPVPRPLAHYRWVRNNEKRRHQFARIRSFGVSSFSLPGCLAGCSHW